MNVQREQTDQKGRFFIEEAGEQLGEMTYVEAGPGKFIIDHTEVDESRKGEGLGKEMVKVAVEYARAHNLKIMPLCPFAKAVFDKNPEFKDVLF